jgi:carbon monoxide dehydrogenase subunit G
MLDHIASADSGGSMKLENEFSVNVPLERAWETLLDIQTVAGFLPGAKIEPTDEEGVFKGAMKIRVGPMSISYQGTARLASVDEENRTVDLEVRAKEAKGQGTAAAVIHNQVVEEEGATRVIAVTDLQVTGRQAQFGRGIMQDVAGRMLTDFAQRFEAYLLEGGENGAAATAEAGPEAAAAAADSGEAPTAAPSRPTPPPAPAEEDALDLGSVVGQMPAVRYGVPAVVLLAVLGIVFGVLRSRRGKRRGATVRFGIKL